MESSLLCNVDEIYKCAYSLYTAGHYQDAERLFRLLTNLDQLQFDYWMGLASALQMQRKYKEATQAYTYASSLEESEWNPFPYARAAECFFSLNELNLAFEAVKNAKIVATKDQKYDALIKQLSFLEERWINHGRNPQNKIK